MVWTGVQRRPDTRNNLRDKVLRTYGVDQDQDSELQTLALAFLDEAIRDMNSHLYEFNKMTESGIALVADQHDYVLDNTATDPGTDGTTVIPYKESVAYLLKTSDSTRDNLNYIPAARFAERLGSTLFSNSGVPDTYSFRNLEQDGTVSLHPAPNTKMQTDHTLTVEFYRRIPLISDLTADSTKVNIPEEVETPLIYAACKRLAIHLLGASHEDVAAFHSLEEKSIEELQAVDKRHPDQQQRFRLVDNVRRGRRAGRRSLYIEV